MTLVGVVNNHFFELFPDCWVRQSGRRLLLGCCPLKKPRVASRQLRNFYIPRVTKGVLFADFQIIIIMSQFMCVRLFCFVQWWSPGVRFCTRCLHFKSPLQIHCSSLLTSSDTSNHWHLQIYIKCNSDLFLLKLWQWQFLRDQAARPERTPWSHLVVVSLTQSY